MKKNLLTFITIALTASFLVGCNKKPAKVADYLRLDMNECTLFEDESFVLNGTTNLTGTISYASENNRIASVSSSGRVIAKKEGQTRIIASIETLKVYCNLTVKPLSEKNADYITFEDNDFAIGLNENQTYQVIPSYHSKDSVIEKPFTYISDDNSIATVNESGIITPIKEGTTSVIVSSGDVSAAVYLDIYTIKMDTKEDWMTMLATTKNKEARFYLNQDIDMSGVQYAPASAYGNYLMGELNGNYHSVKNITMKEDLLEQSIFGFATAFNLKNIAFENTLFTSTTIDNNFGLFISFMHHITEKDASGKDANNVYPASISNVLCDFQYTQGSGYLIAKNFYGGIIQDVFGYMRDVNGEPLSESCSYAIAKEFYLWWDPNTITDVICYVPNGDISIKPASQSTGLPISYDGIHKTDSLIEADFLANTYFDTNVWDVAPNEIPSFK